PTLLGIPVAVAVSGPSPSILCAAGANLASGTCSNSARKKRLRIGVWQSGRGAELPAPTPSGSSPCRTAVECSLPIVQPFLQRVTLDLVTCAVTWANRVVSNSAAGVVPLGIGPGSRVTRAIDQLHVGASRV